MTEINRFRISAMFATNPHLEIRSCRHASVASHFHQLADPFLVKSDERIGWQNPLFYVVSQEFPSIVT